MKIALKECYLASAKLDFKPGPPNTPVNISVQIESNVEQIETQARCIVHAVLLTDDNHQFLDVKYVGIFFIDEKEQIDKDVLSSECTSLVFPYMREFIADITRRVPFQQPALIDLSLGNAEIYREYQESIAKDEQKKNP